MVDTIGLSRTQRVEPILRIDQMKSILWLLEQEDEGTLGRRYYITEILSQLHRSPVLQ